MPDTRIPAIYGQRFTAYKVEDFLTFMVPALVLFLGLTYLVRIGESPASKMQALCLPPIESDLRHAITSRVSPVANAVLAVAKYLRVIPAESGRPSAESGIRATTRRPTNWIRLGCVNMFPAFSGLIFPSESAAEKMGKVGWLTAILWDQVVLLFVLYTVGILIGLLANVAAERYIVSNCVGYPHEFLFCRTPQDTVGAASSEWPSSVRDPRVRRGYYVFQLIVALALLSLMALWWWGLMVSVAAFFAAIWVSERAAYMTGGNTFRSVLTNAGLRVQTARKLQGALATAQKPLVAFLHFQGVLLQSTLWVFFRKVMRLTEFTPPFREKIRECFRRRYGLTFGRAGCGTEAFWLPYVTVVGSGHPMASRISRFHSNYIFARNMTVVFLLLSLCGLSLLREVPSREVVAYVLIALALGGMSFVRFYCIYEGYFTKLVYRVFYDVCTRS